MEVPPVSRFKQLLISLFLLSLIALIVNGLVASDTVISAFPLKIDLSSLAYYFQYSIFLIFLAMSAGALIMLILDWRTGIEALKDSIMKRGDSNVRGFWRTLIGIVASLAFFAIMYVFIQFVKQLKIGDLGEPLISAGNEQPPNIFPQPPSPTTTLTPTPLSPTLFFAFGIIILAIMFVGGLMAVQAMREIREEAEVPLKDDDVLEEKAFNVVKEAISSIIHEGDFRAAIIRCYQRLCELLARYNCQIEDHQTVQEFRISASNILNIPEKPFALLTSRFEEARYSLHEIDEAKRNDALRSLTEIRDHLSSGH